jgi:phosphopentomutase
MDGMDKTLEAIKMDFDGFIFTNLVDFDSQCGHRRDVMSYAKYIEDFDSRLPEVFAAMGDDDILMICADHGNDPVHSGFDHTREYVPLLVYGKKVRQGVDLGIRKSFADVGATVADLLDSKATKVGESFKEEIL